METDIIDHLLRLNEAWYASLDPENIPHVYFRKYAMTRLRLQNMKGK